MTVWRPLGCMRSWTRLLIASKEERLVISGLIFNTPKPDGVEEGRRWMKNIVGDFLNLIETNMVLNIVFANQGSD
jgi:hypothetical protein